MVKSVIAPPSLRSCLGRFATGVAVVTFAHDDEPRGVTINSFTSVSLEPPLVLVSIARGARSHDTLRGRPFCVNVLGAEQEAVARCFAGGPAPEDLSWHAGSVAPALGGALAQLQCRPWAEYDGGDHTLFLGQVVDFNYRHGLALGYHSSGFTTIGEQDVHGSEALI